MQVKQNTIIIVKEFVRKNGWIDLPSHGTSMYPLLKSGDICRFTTVDSLTIKKGDIILFQSNNGQLVAHRFITYQTFGSELKYIFKGDTNLGPDDPINTDQIVGKLTYIKKGNFIITDKNIITFIWKKMILLFPILSALLRTYLNKRIRRESYD